jgi:hypothetical protein
MSFRRLRPWVQSDGEVDFGSPPYCGFSEYTLNSRLLFRTVRFRFS